jgi:hypothetical protein
MTMPECHSDEQENAKDSDGEGAHMVDSDGLLGCLSCGLLTTGFEPFAESEVLLGEGVFLSLKASPRGTSRRRCAGEGVFEESRWDPSLWRCTERPT